MSFFYKCISMQLFPYTSGEKLTKDGSCPWGSEKDFSFFAIVPAFKLLETAIAFDTQINMHYEHYCSFRCHYTEYS